MLRLVSYSGRVNLLWGTMILPPWLSDYGAVSASALAGSLANGGRWRGVDGKFSFGVMVPELAAAVALAVGIMALGEYSHGLIDLKVLAGLGVLGGWLGPKPVADFVIRKFFGGPK